MADVDEKINPFEFHTGIEFKWTGDQFYGACPFCEKEDKFYFNKEWMWDCKNVHCTCPETKSQRSGNLFTFIRQLYNEHDSLTKAAAIVSEWRQIPAIRVQALGLKWNPLNNSIIIPTYRNGKIHNLYRARKEKVKDREGNWIEKEIIRATPELEHTLFNEPGSQEEVWIAEGHWDRIALEAILSSNGEIGRTAVPGAGVFKREWLKDIAGKDVVFLYDNDDAGRAGYQRIIIKLIAESNDKPKSIKYLKWPDGLKNGYDLNDLYIDKSRSAFSWIKDHIVPYEAPEGSVVTKTTIETVQPNKEIDTYKKLLDVFKTVYHTTVDMELGLILALTSVYSINIEGEQIWIRLIGAPGSGKTTIAKAISASKQVVLRSTFTGLFSGWKDEAGRDASLIPTIAGKTLVVKDADTLLQQQNVAKIFSELRDFYDKDSSTQFKNMVHHDYRNIRSTMLLCGTQVLRRSDQSYLGERFLDFEMRHTHVDEEAIKMKMLMRSLAATQNIANVPPETPVMAAAKGFIDHHLMDKPCNTIVPHDRQKLILDLATLVAKMRTKVDRDMMGKGEIRIQPISETPTRLIGQYVKIAQCAPIVTQDNGTIIDTLLKKISKDVIDPTSNRYKICSNLLEGFMSRDELVDDTGIPQTTMNRELDDLRALKLLDAKKTPSPVSDKVRWSFTLKPEIKEGLSLIINQ